MKQLFQIPAVLKGYRTMANGSLKLTVDTQEGVSDDAVSKLHKTLEKFGWFTFSVEKKIEPEDLVSLPEIKPEFKNEKSSSERLKNVLYVYWENNTNKSQEFETFRKIYMDKIIENVKKKID